MKTEGGSLDLGARLRRVRSERGLSLRELGKLAGCSASLISQVERGQTAPSAGVIYGLANALDIPLEYLFGTGGIEDTPVPGGARVVGSPFAAGGGGGGTGGAVGSGAREGNGRPGAGAGPGGSGGAPRPAQAPAAGPNLQPPSRRPPLHRATG
ncbi:helix-turn-helix domain-containing protein, partial [Streptomyces sp. NPDC056734]|uniref:helix-turn-helix domain-containing protein n=1 Tax=Streptomyces sp. NPDC056734 TaxID=3345931 RepID=UPI0036C7A088